MSFDVQKRDQLETGRVPIVSQQKEKDSSEVKRGTLLMLSNSKATAHDGMSSNDIYGLALADASANDPYVIVALQGSFNSRSVILSNKTEEQKDTLLSSKFNDLRKLNLYFEGVQETTQSLSDTTAAGEVTGLTATAGDDKVDLSWTNPNDFDLSEILITWSPGNGSHTIIDKTTNSHTITGLTGSTEYTFTIKTKDDNGNTSSGVTVKATPT